MIRNLKRVVWFPLFLILTACATPGSTLDKRTNLKYSNGYGQEYCPTSGLVLVGSVAGLSATAVASTAVATGVGIGVGLILWANTSQYEQNCKGEKK